MRFQKNDPEYQIISYLSTQTGWTPADKMARLFHISVRTLRNRIYGINRSYSDLILSSNRGYQLDKEKEHLMMEDISQQPSLPDSYEDRKDYILKSLLLYHNTLSITGLLEYFYISDALLQKEIARLRSELAENRLNLRIKKEKLYIFGSNLDKQKFILKMINHEVCDSSFSLSRMQQFFTSVNLNEISHVVTHILGQHEYFLDNYSLLNYILHLGLTIELHGFEDEITSPATEHGLAVFTDDTVRDIVTEIYHDLKELYDTKYTLDDIYQASVLMSTRITAGNVDCVSFSQLRPYIGEEIAVLLDDIIDSVNEAFGIDLADESFMIRFGLHLKRLLVRLENQIPISSLQFNSIKNDYPYIYAVALHISRIIMNHFGYTLSEDEISYITIHIGVLIEEKIMLQDRIQTVLICQDYNHIGTRLFQRLNTIFTDSLFITNLVTNLSALEELSTPEFVISSSPLPLQMSIPHYTVSPLLTDNNIQDIKRCIEELKSAKLKNRLRDQIAYFFKPDLFFTDKAFHTDTDVIEFLCDEMIRHNYVVPNYKELIYEHEAISPSSYGRVAIPHPLCNTTGTSVIAVSINPKPVRWSGNDIYLTFMLSLADQDKDLFHDIFSAIKKLINNDELFKKILLVKNFDEFIDVIINV